MDKDTRRALGLAAFLGGAGVMHFVNPKFFDAVVPDWMPGAKRTVTHVSGVVELGSALLVVHPRTRKLGGLLCLLTFLGVYPANIQSALDGGIKDADPPLNSAVVAWLRLPLQFPLFVWAWRVFKRP